MNKGSSSSTTPVEEPDLEAVKRSSSGLRVRSRMSRSARNAHYSEETELCDVLAGAGGGKDVPLDKHVIVKVFDLQSDVSFEYFSIKHRTSCGS